MNKKESQAKIRKTLREFKAGTLKSSSGEKVANERQALAIALSSAGIKMKKKDASEDYLRAFIRQVLQEEEAMEEEETEEPEGVEDAQEGKP